MQQPSKFDELKHWLSWGHWLDTPQGICLLLSIPICWIGGLASFLCEEGQKPIFLTEGPLLFAITPFLAFLVFVRFGQMQKQKYSSSLLSSIAVLITAGMPFYIPIIRSQSS